MPIVTISIALGAHSAEKQGSHQRTFTEAINDRRFAESIYRAAVASGIMERVAYQDTIAEAG